MFFSFVKDLRRRVKESETAKNIAFTFVSRVLTAIFLFLTMIIISRYFGTDGKGTFTLFFFLPDLIFNIGHLGISKANAFYIVQNKDISKKIFNNSVIQSLLISFLLVFFFLFAYWLKPGIIGNLNPIYFYWALILVPVKFLEKYLQGIFIGHQRFKIFNFLVVLNNALIFILTALCVVFMNKDIRIVLLIYTISSIALSLSYLCICIKNYGFSFSFDKKLFYQMFLFGIKTYLVCLFSYLVLRVDIYMLNIFRNLSDVGLYSVSTNFFDGMNLLASSTALVLFPLMVKYHSNKYAILKKGLKLIAIVLIPLIVLSMFLIKPAILILIGKDFLPATNSFYVLSIALIFWSMTAVINQYYAALKFPNFIIWLWFLGLSLNITLNLIFIPKYGIIAAAFSSLITYFLIWIFSLINIMREHN